jgi:hypothetical protein
MTPEAALIWATMATAILAPEQAATDDRSASTPANENPGTLPGAFLLVKFSSPFVLAFMARFLETTNMSRIIAGIIALAICKICAQAAFAGGENTNPLPIPIKWPIPTKKW